MGRSAKKSQFSAKQFLAAVNGGRTRSNYRIDQVIFSQGDPADAVFYIQKGKIKIVVTSKRGKQAVVSIRGPGDFFGDGCLAGQPLRLAAAIAVTECETTRIEKAEMVHVLHDEPEFSEMFMAHLLARNSRVEADLVDQLFNSSEKRLARTLLLLANYGKEREPEPISTKITQETLADMIGTTRARVSVFMNKFRKLGLIDYNGELKVNSALLNIVLHE
jgi:CRP/FNR family transcriptional regulator, cyclic AMP receptor protein